jgi:hypothetical protein
MMVAEAALHHIWLASNSKYLYNVTVFQVE